MAEDETRAELKKRLAQLQGNYKKVQEIEANIQAGIGAAKIMNTLWDTDGYPLYTEPMMEGGSEEGKERALFNHAISGGFKPEDIAIVLNEQQERVGNRLKELGREAQLSGGSGAVDKIVKLEALSNDLELFRDAYVKKAKADRALGDRIRAELKKPRAKKPAGLGRDELKQLSRIVKGLAEHEEGKYGVKEFEETDQLNREMEHAIRSYATELEGRGVDPGHVNFLLGVKNQVEIANLWGRMQKIAAKRNIVIMGKGNRVVEIPRGQVDGLLSIEGASREQPERKPKPRKPRVA